MKARRAVHEAYAASPLGTRAFVRLRMLLLPLELIESAVPKRGVVLDIGCGRGILAHYLATTEPEREIIGFDIDAHAIRIAARSVKARERISFKIGDGETGLPRASAAIFADSLHHMPKETQEQLLKNASSALAPGGILIVKEMEAERSWRYFWNLFHDRVLRMTGPTMLRTTEAWKQILMREKCIPFYETHVRQWGYHHSLIAARKLPD